MATLEIPDRREAQTKIVDIPVSAKADDGETLTSEFACELPASLADAVAIDGELEVYKRYVNSKVIQHQANERRKLTSTGGGKPRTKAKYLEELGL